MHHLMIHYWFAHNVWSILLICLLSNGFCQDMLKICFVNGDWGASLFVVRFFGG